MTIRSPRLQVPKLPEPSRRPQASDPDDGRSAIPLLPDLLTCAEAAARLRTKSAKLRTLANRGEISFYRIGKSMMFASVDLERYLELSRRPARGEKALERALTG
jgi:excisionase family DNA binding protein